MVCLLEDNFINTIIVILKFYVGGPKIGYCMQPEDRINIGVVPIDLHCRKGGNPSVGIFCIAKELFYY